MYGWDRYDVYIYANMAFNIGMKENVTIQGVLLINIILCPGLEAENYS